MRQVVAILILLPRSLQQSPVAETLGNYFPGGAGAKAPPTFNEALGEYFPIAAPKPPPPIGFGTATEVPIEASTWNRFNAAGWKTDENGNVWVGDEFAKLYLISVGSFWPFPKDYKKKK